MKGDAVMLSPTVRPSCPCAAAATRSVVVKTPSGEPAASTTTIEPTSFACIRATASRTVASARQTTGLFFTSARSGRASTCCSPARRRSRKPALVLEADIVGLARGLERLAEGGHALLGEQLHELEEDLARHHGVAEGRVAADHGHPQALRDRLQAVVGLVAVHYGREQQRVEHGLGEAHAGFRFGELEEAHVERGVVADQHRLLAEAMEDGQSLTQRGLSPQVLGL